MGRRVGALLLGLAVMLGGPAAAPARAADNQPPVAVDDPPVPGCQPAGTFGGAFPIPEDFSYPAEDDWFAWLGACLPTANDADPDGDLLMLELVGQPAHGEATWFQMGANALLLYRADPTGRRSPATSRAATGSRTRSPIASRTGRPTPTRPRTGSGWRR